MMVPRRKHSSTDWAGGGSRHYLVLALEESTESGHGWVVSGGGIGVGIGVRTLLDAVCFLLRLVFLLLFFALRVMRAVETRLPKGSLHWSGTVVHGVRGSDTMTSQSQQPHRDLGGNDLFAFLRITVQGQACPSPGELSPRGGCAVRVKPPMRGCMPGWSRLGGLKRVARGARRARVDQIKRTGGKRMEHPAKWLVALLHERGM